MKKTSSYYFDKLSLRDFRACGIFIDYVGLCGSSHPNPGSVLGGGIENGQIRFVEQKQRDFEIQLHKEHPELDASLEITTANNHVAYFYQNRKEEKNPIDQKDYGWSLFIQLKDQRVNLVMEDSRLDKTDF